MERELALGITIVALVLAGAGTLVHCQVMSVNTWTDGDRVFVRNDGPLPVTGTIVTTGNGTRTEQVSIEPGGVRRRLVPGADAVRFEPRACPHRTFE